ncbi:MAG TPA: hypothetical protein VGM84_19410 [Steroidobacteraceae bacterium]
MIGPPSCVRAEWLTVAEKRRLRSRLIDLGFRSKLVGALRAFGERGWNKLARQPRWRAFVDWQTYYGAYLGADPGQAVLRHTGPLVGEDSRQVELIEGMTAGRLASLVYAPPGCGKSRFALELARRLEKGGGGWEVVFFQHDEPLVREEVNELTQLKSVVLIIDDAHECPHLVKALAGLAAASSATNSVHLICLTRTTVRATVSRSLDSVLPPGAVQEFDLGRPPVKAVRKLVDQLLPDSSPMHRDTIERFARQSYFGAVLVCSTLSGERKLPQSFQRQQLRDRVCHRLLATVAEGVGPIDAIMRVLAPYAALAPVAQNDPSVAELASQLSGLPEDRVRLVLDRVVEAGLFQGSADKGLRPVPDLLGDLFLEETCLDAQGKATAHAPLLLDTVFQLDPLAAGRHCADVGQLFGTAQDVDLVSKLMLERAEGLFRNKVDVMAFLRLCQPLTACRPRTVLDVANTLEQAGILRRNPTADVSYGLDSVEMAACELLLGASDSDPTVLPAALRLSRDVHAAAEDRRTRQHVGELLDRYCRFEVGRSIPHARAVVEMLRAWVTESDAEAATLATSLSAQFLALDVRGEERDADTVSQIRVPLSAVAEVREVRDVAVEALIRGISHTDATVQCRSIAGLESYACHELSPEQVSLDAWVPQLERETGLLTTALLKVLQTTSSLPVWACVELQGWSWWAHPLPVLHRAGVKVLEAIPRSDAYRLWKSLHSQRLPIRLAIPAEHDPAARADHLQGLARAREEQAADQARELFEELDPGYSDIGAWRALCLSVLEQRPRSPIHFQAGFVLSEFARRHSDAAWSFLSEADANGPLAPVLSIFLAELRKHDRERASEAARIVPPASRLEDVWMQVLWGASNPDEAERALLARGLDSDDPQVRGRAAGALLHGASTDPVDAFGRVSRTVARHPTDELLWEFVIDEFVGWAEPVLAQPDQSTDAMRHVAEELTKLFQTAGPHLRWGYQRRTRQLSKALALLAVLSPQPLQDWMQRTWGPSQGGGAQWNDASPLGIRRLPEVVRLIKKSPSANGWVNVFSTWMLREAQLGPVGASALAELCSLDDPRVAELAGQIARRPADAAVKCFADFVHRQRFDRQFAERALEILEVWAPFPEGYGPIEDMVISVVVHGASSRTPGELSPSDVRSLQAIEERRSRGSIPPRLLTTFDRVEHEIHAAAGDSAAEGEELAG